MPFRHQVRLLGHERAHLHLPGRSGCPFGPAQEKEAAGVSVQQRVGGQAFGIGRLLGEKRAFPPGDDRCPSAIR